MFTNDAINTLFGACTVCQILFTTPEMFKFSYVLYKNV